MSCRPVNDIPVIEFVKLSGSGNDFICIDNRDGRFDDLLADEPAVGHFARTLCRRGLGVGADGVIFAVRPEVEGFADIGARVFEADGTEAEMCGNATGCFVHWAFVNGVTDTPEIRVLTPAGLVRGTDSDGEYVRVCIPLPEGLQTDMLLDVADSPWRCNFVITGIPHVVSYVDDLSETDVARWGPLLRHHEQFKPRGANANFVKVLGDGEIAIRTWEFGVEGETLACGTGSAASAIITAIKEDWPVEYRRGEKPIIVHATSGDLLRVYFTQDDDGTIVDVCLETLVRFTYSGQVHPDTAARALEGRRSAEAKEPGS